MNVFIISYIYIYYMYVCIYIGPGASVMGGWGRDPQILGRGQDTEIVDGS